jgi:hypothetical protein
MCSGDVKTLLDDMILLRVDMPRPTNDTILHFVDIYAALTPMCFVVIQSAAKGAIGH